VEISLEGGAMPRTSRELYMRARPSAREDEHFARQEAERMRELARERHAQLLIEERERDRALHFMKCPKCGMQLEEIAFGDVLIDKCFSCDGLWLDKGELDLIRQKESGFMGRMLSVFD
jgi:hypothetical protein